MHRVALWLCLAGLFGRPAAAVGAPVEILANGGLEPPHVAINSSNAYGLVSGLMPGGWSDNSLFAGNHTETTYAGETNGTVQGSAVVVTAAVQSGFTNGACIQMSQVVPGVAGRGYSASVWLKGSKPTNAFLRFRQNTSPWAARATTPCAVTTNWQRFTLSHTPSINESLRLDVNVNNEPMTLWVDEASLIVEDGDREWHVSPSGSDSGDGSTNAPFQTLARAAQSLVAGDTLWLGEGTYRETLQPMSSGTPERPITIAARDGGEVILTGLDILTNTWALTSNGIYVADVGWDLGMGYNQVFVDGAMQHQARHPNHGGGGLFNPALANVTVTNGSAASNPDTITSTSFGGRPDGFFAGARFLGGVGQRWAWQTAVVTNSSGAKLVADPATKSTWWWPDYTGPGNVGDTGSGFVYGLLGLLDADGEWHLQTHSVAPHALHLRIAGGADPSARAVEVKRRNWCVDINNRNHVTVRGIKTRGGAIRLAGKGNVLEGVEASHPSHYMTFANGSSGNGGRAEGGGVVVSGTSNIVRHCAIHDTAGAGILTSGAGHRIERNHVYNADYSGTYGAPLSMDGDGDVAVFNTLHDTGRDVLRPTGSGQTVMFNDLYGGGKLCLDLGMVYSYGTDGIGPGAAKSRIAYNWVHDGNPADPHSKGIYLDNYDRSYLVDHNVVWNLASGQDGIRLNAPNLGHEIHHNTVIQCRAYDAGTWTAFPDSNPDPAFWTTNNHGMDYAAQNNLVLTNVAATASNLVDAAARDFRPKARAPCIDPALSTNIVSWQTPNGATGVPANFQLSMRYPNQRFLYREIGGQGVVLPGVNDGFSGARPDSGAYEYGQPYWVPGVNGWDLDSPGVRTDAPAGLGVTRATARGTLISAGSALTAVRVCWGTFDGGTNLAAWAGVADKGALPGGADIAHDIRGLAPDTTYFYRLFASNSHGQHWGDAHSFHTVAALVWDAGGGANTSGALSNNWQANAVPDLVGGADVATFGSAGGTAMIDTNAFFAGLAFNRDANFTIADGDGALSLGESGITVVLPGTASRTHTIGESHMELCAEQAWTISNNVGAATLNVSSAIGDGTNAFGIAKAGSGTLGLSGDSGFDGAVDIQCGVVSISADRALGSTNGGTIVDVTGSTANGGQLRLGGGITSAEDITISGTTEAGNFARAIDGASGTNTLAGAITLSGGSIRLGAGAGELRLTGPISRAGAGAANLMVHASAGAVVMIGAPIDNNGGMFQVAGAGTVVLAATNNDLGGAVIFFGSPGGPVLRLGAHDALATNRNLTIGTTSASAGADRGTLDLAGFDQAVNALIGQNGSASPDSMRRIVNTAPGTVSTLTIGSGDGGGAFLGVISDGAGAIAVTKVGGGTQALAGTNAYSGRTSVRGGALSLAVPSLSAAADVRIGAGAVLDLAFAGTNTINGLFFDDSDQYPGVWGSLASGAPYKTSLITGGGMLRVIAGPAPSPYGAWAAGFGLDATPGRSPAFDADVENDGLPNGLEWMLDGDPLARDAASLWGIVSSPAGIIIAFLRRDDTEPSSDLRVQWSPNLRDWSDAPVGATSSGPDAHGVTVAVAENGSAPDAVAVTVPHANGTQGRLFVRLGAALR